MDIRNWGQTFMARIKQLPAEASQLAEHLPDTLSHLPEKAQAAMQNLPQNLEDGAKSILANEQIAAGWTQVGQGVGELTGWQPNPDHVAISGHAGGPSDPVANAIRNSASEAKPAKVPTVPRARGHAVIDQPIKPRIKPAPLPAADPLGGAAKQAAHTVPKAKPIAAAPIHAPAPPIAAPEPVSTAVRQASRESGRVTKAVRTLKPVEVPTPAAAPAAVTRAAAKTTTRKAAEVLVPGAKIPVQAKSLSELSDYASVSKHLSKEATLLKQTGNPEAATTLSAFSDRLKRAGQLYKEGNTPAASRMLHAKIKLGLRNPEIQNAVSMANKAEEVKAAFGQAPVATPFAAAAKKMAARADELKAVGHPVEAKQLSSFATRLTHAGEKYAAGDKEAALKMFRKGLDGTTQQALKVSDKADEVMASFGRKGSALPTAGKAATEAKSAATTVKASKQAVAEASHTAEHVIKGSKQAASTATQTVEHAVKGGKQVTSGARQVASSVASNSGKAVETTGKAVRTAKAAKSVEAGGAAATTSAKAATRVAKGASQAKQIATTGKAAKGAVAEVAEATAKGAKAAKQVAGAAEATGAAHGVMNGAVDSAKGFFGKVTQSVKDFFGKIGKGASNSKGWTTIKDGFAKMVPGLKQAAKSSFIFSAVFAVAENLYAMFKGERTWRRALGGILGDTLGGTIGGVVSALASGAAIAGLGAIGLAGLPLTLAAGAIGILGYMAFDKLFRSTSLYDTLTHLMT